MLSGYLKPRGISCSKWLKFDVWSFSGAWDLELGAFLEFGIWCLGFCFSLGFFLVWGLHSIVPASFAFDVALEFMKAIALVLTACAALGLSGCATNQGAASDQYYTTSGASGRNPASPTFRPGMYPDDIRDPNALTRPLTPPPTTPP
jgi:hypothetical protein